MDTFSFYSRTELDKALELIRREIRYCEDRIRRENNPIYHEAMPDYEPTAEKIKVLHARLIDTIAEESKLKSHLTDPNEFLKNYAEQQLCEERMKCAGYRLRTSTGIGATYQSEWIRSSQVINLSSLEEASAYVREVVAKTRPIAQIINAQGTISNFFTGDESAVVLEYARDLEYLENPEKISYKVLPGPDDDFLKYQFRKVHDTKFGVQTPDINEFYEQENNRRNTEYQSAISAGIPEKYARTILTQHAVFTPESNTITILPTPSDQELIYLHNIQAFSVSISQNPDWDFGCGICLGERKYHAPQFFEDPEEALRVINADREKHGRDPIEIDLVKSHVRSIEDRISDVQARAKDQSYCSIPKKAESREEER